MKLYLAGSLRGEWQSELVGEHEFLDPRTWQDPDPAVYTARDLKGLRDCDVVIAFMSSANPSSFGMSLEIGYAHALGRRIIFVDQISEDWRSRYFGMVRSVSEVVETFDEALALL